MVHLHFNTHLWVSSIQQHGIYSNFLVHAAVLCSMNEREKRYKRSHPTGQNYRWNELRNKKIQVKKVIFSMSKSFSSFLTTLKPYKTLNSIKNENSLSTEWCNLRMSFSRWVFYLLRFFKVWWNLVEISARPHREGDASVFMCACVVEGVCMHK